jgi:hypothetical protein
MSGEELPWLAPGAWPEWIRAWFNEVRGADRGPKTLFIFQRAGLYFSILEDALTAAALLALGRADWDVEAGYPVAMFDPACLGDYVRILTEAGYCVRFRNLLAKGNRIATGAGPQWGRVVDISVGKGPDFSEGCP